MSEDVDTGSLEPLGSTVARNATTVFDAPFLRGLDGNVDETTLPETGVVEAETVTISSNATVSIGDMLAIFATDEIRIEQQAEINGQGNCTASTGVYGQGGKHTGEDWINHAYTRCICSEKLVLNTDFKDNLCGGGVEAGQNGGSALLLSAPRVEIEAPVTIDLRGNGTSNDGHFGIVYNDEFIYDGTVTTNGRQNSTTPPQDTPNTLID